jgi:hypothetical protein
MALTDDYEGKKTEITEATWTEFDLVKGVRDVPAERMKTDKPHRIYIYLYKLFSTHCINPLVLIRLFVKCYRSSIAHKLTSIKGVYDSAEYANQRRVILQVWADFVQAQLATSNVVMLPKAA